MGLKKCKECGKEVSDQADKCPHCGAKLKTKIGCVGLAIIIIISLFFLSKLGNRESDKTSGTKETPFSNKEDKSKNIHQMGEGFKVGYTSYNISKAWWSRYLSDNPYLNKSPNESYLLILRLLRNTS